MTLVTTPVSDLPAGVLAEPTLRSIDGPPVLRLLGPLTITPTPRGSSLAPKARTLFAFLVARRGDVLSRDDIETEIWAGRPPASARNAVQVYIWQIRRYLAMVGRFGRETSPLATFVDGYSLQLDNAVVDVDLLADEVATARALVHEQRYDDAADAFGRALALSTGTPLADVPCGPWLSRYRQRLLDLRGDLMQEQSEVLIGAGRYFEAIPQLEDLISSQPFRESAYGRLMAAMTLAGRRPDALGVYDRARGTLREQLGLEPGPELQVMQWMVVSGEPEQRIAEFIAWAGSAPGGRS